MQMRFPTSVHFGEWCVYYDTSSELVADRAGVPLLPHMETLDTSTQQDTLQHFSTSHSVWDKNFEPPFIGTPLILVTI